MASFKRSSISGAAWGAAWEEEVTTAPEDVGCAVLEALAFTSEPSAESQDKAGKGSGFHCHHPWGKKNGAWQEVQFME